MKAWEHLSCEYIEIEIESLQIYIQLTSFLLSHSPISITVVLSVSKLKVNFTTTFVLTVNRASLKLELTFPVCVLSMCVFMLAVLCGSREKRGTEGSAQLLALLIQSALC